MRWEIEEEGNRHEANDEATEESWRTRLSLELPSLGGVDAQIRLQGDQVILSISVNHSETRVLMQTESDSLYRQLQDAGLMLTAISIAQQDVKADDEETTKE